MEKEKTVYLIDGTAYIYRAYHAIRSLSNSKGLPTNAIFGFTRILIKLVEDRNPQYAAMFFDSKGPTFRHEIYPEYKANRPPMPEDLAVQIPYIKNVTAAYNLPIIEIQGFEADDLIGTYARMAERDGFSVVMVTGDKDFMQLVSDNVVIWDPMKEKTINIQTIREDFGIEPNQMINVMGLSGDSADNIPGVPGIGQKTALDLIKTYGDMEHLYREVESITKKKQRENLITYKEQALLSKELVTIDTQTPMSVEIEGFSFQAPDTGALSELFQTFEFRQLQQSVSTKTDLSDKRYTAVTDMDMLGELIDRLESATIFALDTETTSTNPMMAKLVGLSFALTPHEAFYIPCGHNYLGAPEQLKLSEVLNRLEAVLANPDIQKVGQNIKYDWMVLARHGIDLAGVTFDTMLASYLLNPSKRAHNLDQIALDFLGHKTITYEEVAGKGKKAVLFSEVPLEKAVPYACEDADVTLMAKDALASKLEEIGLTNLLKDIEMPLVPVLMRMEMSQLKQLMQ